MKIKLIFFILSFLIPNLKASDRPPVPQSYVEGLPDQWIHLYTKNNIQIFQKEVNGNDLMAFRGLAILNAPLINLLHTLRDVETSKEWTPNLLEKKIISSPSQIEAVTYNLNYLPWPASNRDTVLHSKLFYIREKDHLSVISKSVEDKSYPEQSDPVRGIVNYSNLILQKHPLGILVDIEAHIDPKGWIPSFIVNLIQKKWAYKFLISLEKRARLVTPEPHPDFLKYINMLSSPKNQLGQITNDDNKTQNAQPISRPASYSQ